MEGNKRNNKWKSHRGELQKLKHFYFIFGYLLFFKQVKEDQKEEEK